MNRAALPTRRPNLTLITEWQGHQITVTVGFYPDTARVAEVFANAASGGAMQDTVADACVLISLALQHGIAPQSLTHSMGKVPLWQGEGWAEGPASPVGSIAAAVADLATQFATGKDAA